MTDAATRAFRLKQANRARDMRWRIVEKLTNGDTRRDLLHLVNQSERWLMEGVIDKMVESKELVPVQNGEHLAYIIPFHYDESNFRPWEGNTLGELFGYVEDD